MALTIFFSWQVDRPNGGERNFIERALKEALKRIGADATVEPAVREIEVDRDTKGVPGTPPIVDTIFAKIDRAAIFVPDLTFVAKRADGRPAPNPNVLIEYGWALKSMGHSRMMPVMNIAHGEPTAEAMPFDMRHLRNPILFYLPVGAEDASRRAERDRLSRELEAAIRTTIQSSVLNEVMPKPPTFPAAEAKDGQARFRSRGSSLGITYGDLHGESRDIFLQQGCAAWLRLMPARVQDRIWKTAELKAAATQGSALSPLYVRSGALDWIRAEDGFGVVSHTPDGGTVPAVVFLFTTGELWSIRAGEAIRNAVPVTPRPLSAALSGYAKFLKERLSVQPPYRCLVGVEGVRRKQIWLPDIPGRMWMENPAGSCVTDLIQDEFVYEDGTDPVRLLRPFIEDVYEKCGFDDLSVMRTSPDWN